MLESTTSVIQALQSSKQVLFVMHEYLPLPLALWVPSLVSLLKNQGKDITVLVSQEVFGWPKRIDEVYPTDMVLSLEQLRQVISVPITHNSETIGDVSYNVSEGNLQITVVPVKETLDMTQISTVTHGKTYDIVLGVGISANHPVLNVLQQNQSSMSRAKSFFVGTYGVQAAIAEKLSFIPSVTILDKQEDQFLREILEQLTLEKSLEPAQRELVTLFIQSIATSSHQFDYLDREGYEYLGKIADLSMDSGRMASLYSGDFATQNRILQQILQSAQKSTNGEFLLFSVTSKQIQELNISVQDVVTVLYYLPKYPQVKQIIVVIEENAQKHHVYMNGSIETVKQIAMKYGFPRTEHLTGGFVEGILFEQLCRDVTRIATKEEILPPNVVTYANTNTTAPVVTPMVPAQKLVAKVEVQESPSIPTATKAPTLDEVLANTVMTDDAELDSGEVIDVTPVPVLTQNEIPVQSSPEVPPTVPTQTTARVNKSPTGLDFAAIAKKMRESIT